MVPFAVNHRTGVGRDTTVRDTMEAQPIPWYGRDAKASGVLPLLFKKTNRPLLDKGEVLALYLSNLVNFHLKAKKFYPAPGNVSDSDLESGDSDRRPGGHMLHSPQCREYPRSFAVL